jgi:hypothetical protein
MGITAPINHAHVSVTVEIMGITAHINRTHVPPQPQRHSGSYGSGNGRRQRKERVFGNLANDGSGRSTVALCSVRSPRDCASSSRVPFRDNKDARNLYAGNRDRETEDTERGTPE